MRLKVLISVILLAVLAACASINVYDPVTDLPVGKTYQGTVPFNNMEIPLPEGQWTVIGRGATNDSKFYEIYMFNGKNQDLLHIQRESPINTYQGYVHSRYLARTDMHHVVVKNNNRGQPQDGWLINHFRFSMSIDLSQAKKEARDYLVKHNFALPGNYIQIHHRFAGHTIQRSKFLAYNHFHNPETSGFDPPVNAEWGSSDWHPLKISNDPKKKAYLAKLEKEGENSHAKLKAVFDVIR